MSDQPMFPPGTFMTYDSTGEPTPQALPPITDEDRRNAVLAELVADMLARVYDFNVDEEQL